MIIIEDISQLLPNSNFASRINDNNWKAVFNDAKLARPVGEVGVPSPAYVADLVFQDAIGNRMEPCGELDA